MCAVIAGYYAVFHGIPQI